MNQTNDIYLKNRRLAALKALLDAPGYEMNASVLQSILRNLTGFRMTRDMVLNELLWLGEQGLVHVKQASDDMPVTIVKLTERGMYVALGEVRAEGVDRPMPR
jgi:hypothetical protein